MPEFLFVPLNYILHIVLSILVPSSSGLASLSTPIVGSLAAQLGYSTEVSGMTMVSANGLVNLILSILIFRSFLNNPPPIREGGI